MKRVLLLFILGVYTGTLSGQVSKEQRQKFVSANYTYGTVFQTNDFVSGENRIPAYQSYSVRYGFTSKTQSLYDYVYGLPYWGVGLYKIDLFGRKRDFGSPLSIYLLQGARLAQFSDRLKINYEWNLGLSFNWNHYDQFTNPHNIAIGASSSVHISGSIYLKWIASQYFDFNIGLSATHFSNGKSNTPNYGLNMAGAFFGIAYSFDRATIVPKKYVGDETLDFTKRTDQEITFTVSRRTIELDTLNNTLVYKYPDRTFRVYGLGYAVVFVPHPRYKWGPSLDVIYDESGGVFAKRERDPITHTMVDRIYLGQFQDRLVIGASLMGELSMPYYSIFAHLGYDLIRSRKYHPEDSRLYQVLGAKIYFNHFIYATFGIRATRVSSAQFLYWSLGYRIKGR